MRPPRREQSVLTAACPRNQLPLKISSKYAWLPRGRAGDDPRLSVFCPGWVRSSRRAFVTFVNTRRLERSRRARPPTSGSLLPVIATLFPWRYFRAERALRQAARQCEMV
jgi:hypothetical protein